MVGVVRGQRVNNLNSFAIAINERDVERGDLLPNIFFTKTTEVLYFIRKTLQLTTYEEALDAISKERLTTSAYYTIGGTFDKGGCVVERSSGEVHNTTCLGPKGADPWFIV